MQLLTDRGIKIRVTLLSPVDQVWKAWTDPGSIAGWWGPDGFTNTIHRMDVEAGGEWRLTMHGPDGKNYPNRSVFEEVIPFKKIVFRHFNPNYLAIISFEEKNDKTQLEWTMEFETPEIFDTVVKTFKADEGLTQNVQKLKEHLFNLKNR